MSEHKSHFEIKQGTERGFGIVFAVVFAIIGLYPLIDGGAARLWSLAIAAVFLLLAFARPQLLRPLNRLWFKFGMLLGHVIAPLIMALLFFVAVTPTGLIRRAMGKDPMRLKLDPSAASYWLPRDEDHNPMQSMRNQF